MVELAKFLEKMITMKNHDFIIVLLKENWKETFGALDYLPSNYNIFSHQFKYRFLHFLENESKMLIPREGVPPEFTIQVEIRYRAMFLFDYVMINHFAEENVIFVATVGRNHFR